MGPDLFYPEKQDDCEAPKSVCAGCPVRTECLAFAMVTNEKFGIWGGLSERQRRRRRGWDAKQYRLVVQHDVVN